MLQAIVYTWLGWKITGKVLPFYFYVWGSTPAAEARIFKVEIDQYKLEEFDRTPKFTYDMLDYYMAIGWEARPDYKECADCPLADSCKDFTGVPLVQKVHLV